MVLRVWICKLLPLRMAVGRVVPACPVMGLWLAPSKHRRVLATIHKHVATWQLAPGSQRRVALVTARVTMAGLSLAVASTPLSPQVE